MLYFNNKVVLLPGDFYFGSPEQYQFLQTLLGSCIAITLWHPATKKGGMCHFVIPENVNENQGKQVLNGRYGDQAIKLFQQNIMAHTSCFQDYQLGLYGGMSAININKDTSLAWVAKMNIDYAVTQIIKNNLVIAHRFTGGSGALKVSMNLANGKVDFHNITALSRE